jgi:uncharacterized protein
MEFQNNQVNTDSLPSFNQIEYEALEINYRNVSMYATAAFFIFVLATYLITGIFVEELYHTYILGIVVIGWALLLVLSLFISYKAYQYEGYALRQNDITYKSGMFFRSVLVIPFNRIQHCEINQGPIDRWFGLAELSLFTAGGSSSDLNVPGLTMAKASSIKQFVTTQISADEEE